MFADLLFVRKRYSTVGRGSSITSASLLARIRIDDRDENAWREFVERYGPRIYDWCRIRNLRPPDAEDVTQDVLIRLAKHLGTFEYDPAATFRGWLRRVAENAIADFYRARGKTPATGRDNGVQDSLESIEARQDLHQRLNAGFDLELLDLAKARVKARIDKDRWLAWELTAVAQLSGEEVSERLQMKLPTVYSNRSKVQKMISDEIQLLDGLSPGDALSQS